MIEEMSFKKTEMSLSQSKPKGEIDTCRSCGASSFAPILNLGDQYITNFVETPQHDEKRYPLELIICETCNLVQLRHNAPPEKMWNDQYWYQSGISVMIREDLKDIADSAEKLANLQQGDLVIDIGCNDGTLLGLYDKEGIDFIGFEPSKNVARMSSQKGFRVINNFFNAQDFKREFGDRKAKLITAISMFYDLEDPNQFMEDIVSCLDKDGLFIIQQNYLASMLEQNAFDNICHEHREYYSLTSMKPLLDKYNLEVFDVALRDINGGSIRTYIRFKGNTTIAPFKGASLRVSGIEQKENMMGLDTLEPYLAFSKRITALRDNLVSFITSENAKGKNIAIYGASTRGNVTLQYFGLTRDHITFIADRNKDKWGKLTIGSHIPIVSSHEINERSPDYLIVMVWHLLNEIRIQEADYLKRGGKLIAPLPEFEITEHSPEFNSLVSKKLL